MKSTANYVIGLVALLCAGVAGNVHAQCPHQGLASFGPISPAGFGYPAYYVDQNGVGLKACQDPADPVCAAVLPPLPNPAAPLDIAAGNFFSEFPYTFINATVPMPGGGIGINTFPTPLDPSSCVSTWLRGDATPAAQPAGAIGDCEIPHPITGSPCGTNFFRVEGPGLPPGGVQTNLFNLMGKKGSFC